MKKAIQISAYYGLAAVFGIYLSSGYGLVGKVCFIGIAIWATFMSRRAGQHADVSEMTAPVMNLCVDSPPQHNDLARVS